MKFNESEDNNNAFLSTLQNKLRSSKYQSKQWENRKTSAIVKLTALIAQLNDTIIADTQIMNLNEEVLVRRCSLLDSASFRLLVQRMTKSKRFFSELSESMTAWLHQLQQKNAFVTEKQWRLKFARKKNELSHWDMSEDGLLRRSLAVYVSNDSVTKEEILRMHHDDSDARHFARSRTEAAIRKKYFWFSMLSEIDEYVRICLDCQRMRVHYYKSYEKLKSIPSGSERSFHTVTLDFITDMSSARNSYIEKISDAILVIVDKLIKYATYIATIKNLTALELEELLWREFVSHHDMMRNIIFD